VDDPVEAAYAQALKLLARREHGRAELSRKLSQRGHSSEHIAPALQRLDAAGYLSETRYAQARVAELRRRRYGPLRAQAELRAHGVDEAAIADAVQVEDCDWYRACAEACARTARTAPGTPAERARLQRQLATRGFTSAQIRAALGKNSSERLDSDDA
jgi:regulatory protein